MNVTNIYLLLLCGKFRKNNPTSYACRNRIGKISQIPNIQYWQKLQISSFIIFSLSSGSTAFSLVLQCRDALFFLLQRKHFNLHRDMSEEVAGLYWMRQEILGFIIKKTRQKLQPCFNRLTPPAQTTWVPSFGC